MGAVPPQQGLLKLLTTRLKVLGDGVAVYRFAEPVEPPLYVAQAPQEPQHVAMDGDVTLHPADQHHAQPDAEKGPQDDVLYHQCEIDALGC